jgi:hypothetical protein
VTADAAWLLYAAAERRADRSRKLGDRGGELIAAGQAAYRFDEWLAACDREEDERNTRAKRLAS